MMLARSTTARVAVKQQQQRVTSVARSSVFASPKQRAVEARIFGGGDNKGERRRMRGTGWWMGGGRGGADDSGGRVCARAAPAATLRAARCAALQCAVRHTKR